MTRPELAKKFGISERTVTRHMTAKGIEKGSKAAEHRAEVEQEIKEALIDDAKILATRIRETKEAHYKLSDNFMKLAWEEILKAKKDNIPYSTAMNNLKALNESFSIIKKVREEKWAVLGLDKDDISGDDVPTLVIEELTAEEIEALQEREENELEALPTSDDGIEGELGIAEED